MRHYFVTMFATLMMIAIPSVAVAQPSMWTEKLTRAEVGPSLSKLIGAYEAAVKGPCVNADFSFDLKQGTFENDPYTSAVRKEIGADFALQSTAILYKCENREYQLMQFIFNTEEKFKMLIVAPGDSKANYTLQKDLLDNLRATELSASRNSECMDTNSEEILVRNQQVDAFEKSESDFSKWIERWELVSCNGFVDYEIEFFTLPNGNTGFRAKRQAR